jgi:hypothetical protein
LCTGPISRPRIRIISQNVAAIGNNISSYECPLG